MKKFGVNTIVAVGIGSAIFFLLGRFVSIPVFAATYINFQYAILGFFSVVFGPLAGLLIGLIGHSLIDLFANGFSWAWIIGSGTVGLLTGVLCSKLDVSTGEFGKKGAVRFVVSTLVANAVAWGVIAPVLDIVTYAEPDDKVFFQGAIAGAFNSITSMIIGTLLLAGYAATRIKKGSLDIDR